MNVRMAHTLSARAPLVLALPEHRPPVRRRPPQHLLVAGVLEAEAHCGPGIGHDSER